ncbi:MAG TPA: hypothetical protein VNI52_02345 [Sphingobacteriaceae bacterium]|nr:hypothetical protein [Sphingobacteriaceae bacterium]
MIAVIYSGSRFADWKLADKGKIISNFKTVGINPFFNDEKFITQVLNKNDSLITYAERIKKIYFFGAGASSKERNEIISGAFSKFFKFSKISVDNDLKAGAIAACGDKECIIGILGSGSNAAYFDGKKIKLNNFGLGFVLADEGSANWMGKKILKSFLNETLPPHLVSDLRQKYGLDRKLILDKVYRQPQPVLYLSLFADYLLENKTDQFIETLVKEGFNTYCTTYLVPLSIENPGCPIHIVGTIAFGFEAWLREVAEENNLTIATIIKEPIYNVLNYYSDKN